MYLGIDQRKGSFETYKGEQTDEKIFIWSHGIFTWYGKYGS